MEFAVGQIVIFTAGYEFYEESNRKIVRVVVGFDLIAERDEYSRSADGEDRSHGGKLPRNRIDQLISRLINKGLVKEVPARTVHLVDTWNNSDVNFADGDALVQTSTPNRKP